MASQQGLYRNRGQGVLSSVPLGGQELHLTNFVAPRVAKSTDPGEDVGVTSKWKHTYTVLKKPLAAV